jgi:hypothetical protein
MFSVTSTIVLDKRRSNDRQNIPATRSSIIFSNLLEGQVDDQHVAEPTLQSNQPLIRDLSQELQLNGQADTPHKIMSNYDTIIKQNDCSWVNRTKNEPPYFLTALVLLRIFKESEKRANLTTREMKQWLEYLRYSGVEHVYLYDAFVTEDESQKDELELFFRDKFITYVDWHEHNPHTLPMKTEGYQDCLDRFGSETMWQTAIDIDEYPFSPADMEPGFLARFVKSYAERNPEVSEICMQNFLFLGKPISKRERELLFERLWRRDPGPSNKLVKPIYKPGNVKAAIHHNRILRGKSRDAPINDLRMNHYWGARLQNWGDDTPEILARTIEDRSMEKIVVEFKMCEKYVRPYLR